MRDKLNKTMKNDVTKLLNKFGINDNLSFDKPFESMLDDTMTTGLKLSETNKPTIYKLTDTITFIIPDKLDSCYSGGPMTIFVLLVDNLSFRSRDTKNWVAQGFGQVELKEDLTLHQEYEIVNRFCKDTDRHRNLLLRMYQEYKKINEDKIEHLDSTKIKLYCSLLDEAINRLNIGGNATEVDNFIKNKRKEMSI